MAPQDGPLDVPGDSVRVGRQRGACGREPLGHRCPHDPRLHREHGDAAGMEPIPQPGEIGRQSGLRRAVGIVALPPAITGHRGDGGEKRPGPILERPSRGGQNHRRRRESGIDRVAGLPDIKQGPRLVRERPVTDDDPVGRCAEQRRGGSEQSRHRRAVGGIEHERGDGPAAADPQIIGERGQPCRVATGDHEIPAPRHEPPPQRACDARRRPDEDHVAGVIPFRGTAHEQFPGALAGERGGQAGVIPRRLDWEEANRPSGSYRRFTARNSSRRGYIARKVVPSMSASLAR